VTGASRGIGGAIATALAEDGYSLTLVDGHRERFSRIGVLINSAGLGVSAEVARQETRFVDMQLEVTSVR
jgi:short-subunit dehydrogenase